MHADNDQPTGGDPRNDDAVWQDLVARLEATEPGEGFLAAAAGPPTPPTVEGSTPLTAAPSAPTPASPSAPTPASPSAPTPETPAAAAPANPADLPAPGSRSGTKGVQDFDPLGVWRLGGAPAPDPTRPAPRSGPRDYTPGDPDPEDGPYVPEELPKLSATEPALLLAWVGAAGGPLFLVFAAIFWRSLPVVFVVGVVAAFLAGTGYLISRLPSSRDPDDGDGAVV